MHPRAVTVVVPTRDRRPVLALTLRAARAQRGLDELEVIVVDDGSADDTADYVAGLGPDVRLIRLGGGGVEGARNAGLEAARLPWVAFCDDDDLWAPVKLAAQLDRLDATDGARWSCTGSISFDSSFELLEHQRAPAEADVLPALLGSNIIPGGGSSVLAETSLLREVGGFSSGLAAAEDWNVWLQLAVRSPLAAVDRPLVGYRIWSGSKSREVGVMDASLAALNERWRPVAEERGVAADRFSHRRYMAKQLVRNGRRMAAARAYVEIAVLDRRPAQLARAAGALLAPALVDRVGAERARKSIPTAWRTEFETWMGDLRAGSAVA